MDDPEGHSGAALVESTGRSHEIIPPNNHRPIIRMSVVAWLVFFLFFGGAAGTYTISINLGRFSGIVLHDQSMKFFCFFW